ncbi:hypothetical protein PVAP13_4NG195311 [Panicum virgatum]|uniref:Uncharacterized protein n=1 Tax=Panicum virgatum TaxID=38727 RepID=A0A8T0T6I9_PANVG|nr:hypothetical protein PVAP13_4NG195311 [Panicum virgatum]
MPRHSPTVWRASPLSSSSTSAPPTRCSEPTSTRPRLLWGSSGDASRGREDSGAVDGRKDCRSAAAMRAPRGCENCGLPPAAEDLRAAAAGVPVGSAIPVGDGDGDILSP